MKRILPALFLLLSCPFPGVHAAEDKRVMPYVRLAPGQGMVMMRIILNRPLSAQTTKWSMFDVIDVASGQKYTLEDLYDEGHLATYVMSLPPGEYRADRMRVGSRWADLADHGYATFPPEGAWRFKVEAGRMTNLGTALFFTPYGPDSHEHGELKYDVLHVVDDTLPQRDAFLFHPDDYPALLSKALGWTSLPRDMTAAQLPAALKRFSQALSQPALARDGGMLFGENFGQIAWRHPGGSWSWDDTGTIETILSASEAPDGTRWAAAEGSILLHRDSPGNWRRVPVDLEDARPCLLHTLDDGSLITVWEQFMKITALRFRPGATPEWTREWEMAEPWGKVKKYMGLCKALQSPGGAVAERTFTLLFESKIKQFAWLRSPNEPWVQQADGPFGLGIMPDGELSSFSGHVNQVFQLSADGGKTWVPHGKGSKGLSFAQFRTMEDGFSTWTYGDERAGFWRLFHTRDGGKNWAEDGRIPPLTDWFLVLSGHELLARTTEGWLYTSADDGKTWRRDRNPNELRN